MNTYLALTIGPIYKTINASQRTRMLWGASFLFSYLIRELSILLKTGILDEPHPECKIAGRILIPFVGDDKTEIADRIENNKCIAGEGKYPDRILIHSEEGDFEKVQKAVEVLIKFLAKEIGTHTKNEKEEEQIVKDLTSYLQFYFIEKEIGEKENALLSLYDDLDVLELRSNYLASDANYYLFYYLFYLSIRSNNKYSLLAKNAFPDKEEKRFRSLIEISTAGYKNSADKDQYKYLVHESFIKHQKTDIPKIDPVRNSFRDKRFNDDDDKQDEFIRMLKSGKNKDEKPLFSIPFRKYHQYVAVIYADGDNIGTTLKEIGNNDEKLKIFSKKLLDFNSVVVTIINNYGGAPVYIGGEDIFAFVPLASIDNESNKQVTIFDLIQRIDDAFGKYFTKDYAKELGVVRPTLSFGVAIAYYKNPLNETMKMAHDLLSKAKKAPEKNAIELILEEHSGQQFCMSIKKNKKDSYKIICDLIESLTSKVFSKEKEDEQEKKFINSITHKLKDRLFKTLLLTVAEDHRRLDEFFNNSFNEPIHRGEMAPYIVKVKELTKAIFVDYCDDETRIQNLYSTLRLIDFMHKNPKEE
jgi:CRISPR-associated protein Cmr2